MFAVTPTTQIPTAISTAASMLGTVEAGVTMGRGYAANLARPTEATLSPGVRPNPPVPAPPTRGGRQEVGVTTTTTMPAADPRTHVGFGAKQPNRDQRFLAFHAVAEGDCQSLRSGYAAQKPDARGADPRWLASRRSLRATLASVAGE